MFDMKCQISLCTGFLWHVRLTENSSLTYEAHHSFTPPCSSNLLITYKSLRHLRSSDKEVTVMCCKIFKRSMVTGFCVQAYKWINILLLELRSADSTDILKWTYSPSHINKTDLLFTPMFTWNHMPIKPLHPWFKKSYLLCVFLFRGPWPLPPLISPMGWGHDGGWQVGIKLQTLSPCNQKALEELYSSWCQTIIFPDASHIWHREIIHLTVLTTPHEKPLYINRHDVWGLYLHLLFYVCVLQI